MQVGSACIEGIGPTISGRMIGMSPEVGSRWAAADTQGGAPWPLSPGLRTPKYCNVRAGAYGSEICDSRKRIQASWCRAAVMEALPGLYSELDPAWWTLGCGRRCWAPTCILRTPNQPCLHVGAGVADAQGLGLRADAGYLEALSGWFSSGAEAQQQ